MRKRIVGIFFEEDENGHGVPTPLELPELDCKCIKDRKFVEPIQVGSGTSMHKYPEGYDNGEIYPFCVEVGSETWNGYRVYIGNECNLMTKAEFDEHFIEVTEWRDNLIDDILDDTRRS